MPGSFTRRGFLGAAAAVALSGRARAAEPIRLRFADSTTAEAPRSQALVNIFAKRLGGLEVYTPDIAAFQAYSNKKYLASPLSAGWPKGMLDKINAL